MKHWAQNCAENYFKKEFFTMKTTKILALILAVLMAVGCLAACGGGTGTPGGNDGGDGGEAGVFEPWSAEDIAQMGEWIKEEAAGGTITLKLWQPDAAVTVFTEQTKRFIDIFKDYATIKIEVVAQGENDAASQVVTDPTKAADVFGCPSDQLIKLYDANVLMDVYFPDQVTSMNKAEIAEIAKFGDKYYAYPETGDNSYVLAYDKSLLTADDVKSFEALLAACKAAEKKFLMDAGNSFFACTFLYTGGLVTTGVEYDEEDNPHQVFNDYDIDQVTASVKAFADIFTSYAGTFEANNTTATVDGFKNGTIAAGVAGSWNVAQVKEVLGDNAGFAVLPTININGTDTITKNMFGYKYIGVNRQSKFPATSQCLAYYLTNEECQQERAEKLEWGPANLKVMESDFVKNNEAMKVFIEQSNNSVPQANLSQTFWNPVDALGGYIIEAKNDHSTEAIKAQVELCIANIKDY